MKKITGIVLILALLFALAGCGGQNSGVSGAQTDGVKMTVDTVNVCVLTGPTGVGAVQMWEKSAAGNTGITYNFSAASAPDEAVAKLSSGDADIAAIATNLAAKLYQKTEGGIRVLAVNTLGVLSVLDNTGAEISSLADLAGRKIVTTGQGANPQYIIEYLFGKNGVDMETDVTVEYKAEGTELAAVWATEPDAVIIAPSPVSASILTKYEDCAKVLDLTEEWEKVSPDSALMMGCIAARADFCEQHPEAVKAFLEEYGMSIAAAEADPAGTGALCEKYGIVAKAAIAEKALPDCHICCITGDEMKTGLLGYLQVLYDADPSSVGALPDDGFFRNS